MDWTAGYASDVTYTSGFYRDQSPVHLSFCCAIAGIEPVDPGHPFTYCELGFGRGLTVSMLAAANPHGQFYATDFNPAQAAEARALAEAAGLSNLTLLERSFADMAAGGEPGLPQFDYITLHGIYTWVTVENREHIVRFIDRYLKPGGIVYVSYNALPGWSPALPLQRLLIEHADLHPGPSDVQVKNAAAFVHALASSGTAYFTANPATKQRLDGLVTSDPHYLVHEYMHRHWQPVYHVDIARHMANAKLDFVGSTELCNFYPELFLTPEKIALLEPVTSAPLRETVKDYFFNTGFRKDVYVRGTRRMAALRQRECVSGYGLALSVPREKADLDMTVSLGKVKGSEKAYGPLLDALAQRPHGIAELAALPALARLKMNDVVQMAAMLVAAGHAEPYLLSAAEVSRDACYRLNRVIAHKAHYDDTYQALAAPLLGNGSPANIIECLVFGELSAPGAKVDLSALSQSCWTHLKAQGRSMRKEGKPIAGDEANLEALTPIIAKVLRDKLPIWRQRGLL